MQPDELLAEHLVHSFDACGVRPVGVVDGCEHYSFGVCPLGGVHHVGRIQAVYEVRWEGTFLARAVDWQFGAVPAHHNTVHKGPHLVSVRLNTIWLYNW